MQWVNGNGRTQIEVSNLDATGFAKIGDWPDEQWSALLMVSVKETPEVQMLGSWEGDAAAQLVRFIPKFPLTPGVTYRAVFDTAEWPSEEKVKPLISSVFRMPQPRRGAATVVANVFPSALEVPENLLKFYLHFSAPMSGGRIYEHIHLRDENGKDVELPFLEIDEELWDPEMKRLTLFIDPGRIKREVRPLEEIGPALEEGKGFTLVIDREWLDATGAPLAKKFEHTFRVGPADRRPIVPNEWKINAPAAGSMEPLTVDFGEAMDRALALRLLRVARKDRSAVEGDVAMEDSERRWVFRPAKVWEGGMYRLVVPTTLEDLAGNNVGKAFEVEMGREDREVGKVVTVDVMMK